MPSAETYLMEGGAFDVVAVVDYTWHPACGDGWHEPREPAHGEITGVTLYRVERVLSFDSTGESRRVEKRTRIEEPVPAWITAYLEADEYLQEEMADPGEPDPDRD